MATDDTLTVLRTDAKEDEPLVELEAVDYILGALEGMSVPLDADPLSGGPKRLQGKVARARNLLSKVQRWYHIVSRADYSLNRQLLLVKTEIEVKMTDLLANDPEVRNGGSAQKDREAVAQYKLRDIIGEKFKLEQAVHDTTAVLRAIAAKRTDLKDTVSRLRDQMRLCQDELSLGGKWGSKIPESGLELEPRPELSQAIADDADLILGDVLGSGDGASDLDFEVPSQATAVSRAGIRLNSDDPLLPSTDRVAPFPEKKGATEETVFATTGQADEALDALDMDELDAILAEETDPPDGHISPVEAVDDGLPDDFWT